MFGEKSFRKPSLVCFLVWLLHVAIPAQASDFLRCQVADLYENGSTIAIDGQIQVAVKPAALKRLIKTSVCPHFFGGLQQEFEAEVNFKSSPFSIKALGRAYTLSFHHELPDSPVHFTLRVPKDEWHRTQMPVWMYAKRYVSYGSAETRYEPVARAQMNYMGDLTVEVKPTLLDRRPISPTSTETRYETTVFLATIAKK